LDWKQKPELLRKLGKNSRKLAESTYDESILTKKFVDIVNSLSIASRKR